MDTPIVDKSISKNRFSEIKKYIHFADNSNIDIKDKFAKVRPLYDITIGCLDFGIVIILLTSK